jgi:hypothetical protein
MASLGFVMSQITISALLVPKSWTAFSRLRAMIRIGSFCLSSFFAVMSPVPDVAPTMSVTGALSAMIQSPSVDVVPSVFSGRQT